MTESPSQSSSSVDVLRRRARRRLVGAALLALVAAVSLPLMFEKEPPPMGDEVDIRIPPVDKTPFDPKPITGAAKEGTKDAGKASLGTVDAPKLITQAPAAVVAAASTAAAVVATPEKSPTPVMDAAPKAAEKTQEIAKTAPQVLIEKPAEKKAPEKAPEKIAEKATEKTTEPTKAADATKPADADGPKTDPVAGDYVVQLIAVRDTNSAMKALARARELGYKTAYREKLDVNNGTVTRVRVGPYKDKAFAEKIRNKLATQEFEAVVVPIK
jgi:DedD protein